jgi:hypothetical protein
MYGGVELFLHPHLHPVYKNNPYATGIYLPEEFQGDRPVFDITSVDAIWEHNNQPHVHLTRTEIWCSACNIEYDGEPPQLYLTDMEDFLGKVWTLQEKEDGRPLVGIGWSSFADERDYPHMWALVKYLSQDFNIVILTNQEITDPLPDNVWVADNYDLRSIFSIVKHLDFMVSVDTAFVHIAGAFSIPTYCIFGPIDPYIRMKVYDMRYFVQPKFTLCKRQPCWYEECEYISCLKTLRPKVLYEDIVPKISMVVGLSTKNKTFVPTVPR